MTEKNFRTSWKSLALILLFTLGGGALVGFLTRDSMQIYDTIVQPPFAPPGWLFSVVWTILYAAMSVSLWLMLRSGQHSGKTVALYIAQLLVNLIWPFLFFVRQAFGFAFWWLILLDVLVFWLMMRAFGISRLSGWLLAPYAAWVSFASVLCFAVARLNV